MSRWITLFSFITFIAIVSPLDSLSITSISSSMFLDSSCNLQLRNSPIEPSALLTPRDLISRSLPEVDRSRQ